MVKRAKRLIRRYHIDGAKLGAEDAVNGARSKLCQSVANGRLRPIRSLHDFVRGFRLLIKQIILDELKHRRARKGGGEKARDGRATVSPHVDANLDAVMDSRSPQPDIQIAGELSVEWIL
jgi:hypothetical protein